MALLNLKHILVDVLPSLAMKEQVQLLRIPNHLEILGDSLWAINAMIMDGKMQASYLETRENLKWKERVKDELQDVELLKEWLKDVDLAVMDVEALLSGILDWTSRATAAVSKCNLLFDGQVVFRHFILMELKVMAGKLNFLQRKGFALGLRIDMLESMHPLREEYSDILRDEVVGREKDRDNIIETLQGNIDLGVLSIIPICAYNDVGMTTLALLVYHDLWVRQSFQHRIWVNAVPLRDYMRIAGEIVTRITGKESYGADWSVVRDLLGESRFLLILDDLQFSQEEEDKWEALKHILRRMGGPGSAVILTCDAFPYSWSPECYLLTRIFEDAEAIIFLKHALVQHDQEDGQTILSAFLKLDQLNSGLTDSMSFVKVMGSIFRYNKMGTNTIDPLMQLLDLVWLYSNPSTFRRTLLFKSWFPVNDMLSNEDVLHLLIVEDMVPIASDGKFIRHRFGIIEFLRKAIEEFCFMMKIGEERRIPEQCFYLSLLVDSQTSLLFPPTLLLGLNNKLRALLILHHEEEEDKKYQAVPAEIPKHIFPKLAYLRILYLREVRIQKLPKTIGKMHRLRYLKLHMVDIVSLPQTLCKLFNLRILSFHHCEELRRLPSQIHKLQNLQILKLAYCTKLKKLPGSLTRLVNLQELDVQGCHWLKELPEDLSLMKNLENISIAECASLTQMPRKIGELTRLQKLSRYIAVYDDNHGGSICAIPELQALTNLQQVHVQNLERVSNFAGDIQPAKVIQENTRLEHLALEWEWWDMDSVAKAASVQIIAEGFKPNSNLRKLEMVSYMGKDFPGWMKAEGVSSYLNFLVEIRLINLKRCEKLPPLGQLPKLETVEISGMDSIRVVDAAIYGTEIGTFPSLRKLTLSEMLMLEEWHMVETKSRDLFTQLDGLTLIQCPKFRGFDKSIINYRWLIMTMWLNNETLLTYEFGHHRNFDFINKLEIVGCQELRCLPQAMKYWKNLWGLKLVGCNQLVALPDLKSLRTLTIFRCSALRCLPQAMQYWKELRRLKIVGCNRLVALPDWLQDLESLTKLTILYCSGLQYILKGLSLKENLLLNIKGCPNLQL